jgi:hypothetical protein
VSTWRDRVAASYRRLMAHCATCDLCEVQTYGDHQITNPHGQCADGMALLTAHEDAIQAED